MNASPDSVLHAWMPARVSGEVTAVDVAGMLTQGREIAKIDQNLPPYFAGTPKQHLEAAGAAYRIIATMLTLFVVPVVYAMIDDFTFGRLFAFLVRTVTFGRVTLKPSAAAADAR